MLKPVYIYNLVNFDSYLVDSELKVLTLTNSYAQERSWEGGGGQTPLPLSVPEYFREK